jgi:hypothetical protein
MAAPEVQARAALCLGIVSARIVRSSALAGQNVQRFVRKKRGFPLLLALLVQCRWRYVVNAADVCTAQLGLTTR